MESSMPGYKGFFIAPHVGGAPVLNLTDLSAPNYVHLTGWVQIGTIGGFGAFLASGTGAELLALNAAPGVIGLCAMSESGNVRWAELDGTITTAQRTKWNAWLTARSYPTIPVGTTYRAIVLAVFKRLNNLWSLSSHDILGV